MTVTNDQTMDSIFNEADKLIANKRSAPNKTPRQSDAEAAWIDFRDKLFPKLLHAFQQHVMAREGRSSDISDLGNVAGVELFSFSEAAIGEGAKLTFTFNLARSSITPEVTVRGRRTRHEPCNLGDVTREWANRWFGFLVEDFLNAAL